MYTHQPVRISVHIFCEPC